MAGKVQLGAHHSLKGAGTGGGKDAMAVCVHLCKGLGISLLLLLWSCANSIHGLLAMNTFNTKCLGQEFAC